MNKDTLGDRMKDYENCTRITLPKRVPKIIRVDGKAFHTLLKGATKPYDTNVALAMIAGAQDVIKEIGGTFRLAYIQSDECTFVLNDGLTHDTEPWFGNNILKMASVTASLFTGGFNYSYTRNPLGNAAFDARVFIVPDLCEVVNNLIWRQQDATRNSVNTYARSMFSHNELQDLSNAQMQDKMFIEKQFNWNDTVTWTKRGLVVTREKVDWEIPIFTQNRDYIKKLYLPAEPNESTI